MLRASIMTRIIIDAGHGGSTRAGNSSAYGSRGSSGLLEKDVTLDIARHVVTRLGGDAALTRAGDANLPLGARAAHASRDGADVFVSIHANSGPPEMAGPETWVHPDAGADSHQLAGGIQRALERLAGRYGGSVESRRGPMAVLSPSVLGRRTAACLVEVDYLSNPRGEQRLRDPNERIAIGAAIAGAIREHVGGLRYGQQAQYAPNRDFVLRGNEPVRIGVNARVGNRTVRIRGSATLTQGAHTPRLRVRLFDQAMPDQPMGNAQYVELAWNTPVPFDLVFRLQLTPGIYWIELAIEGSDPTARVQISGRNVLLALNENEEGEPAEEVAYGHRDRQDSHRYGQTAQALERPSPDPFIIPDPAEYTGRGLLDVIRAWGTWFAHYARWRTGVPDAAYSSFPHTAICELEMTLNNGHTGYGTGFYIGPEKILTCGHNFKHGAVNATSVIVRPGKRPRMSVMGHRVAIPDWRVLVHPNWATSEDSDFDLAVLRTPGLSAPGGQVFSLPTMSPAGNQNIVVCGYGKFRDHPDPPSGQGQYMDGAQITHATAEQYHFPIQSIPGHSGSPVFWPAENAMVVAVLTGPRFLGPVNTAPISDYENRGVRLTPDKNDWIDRQ